MTSKPTVGVLGGGQLARMLCEAAGPLGIPVAVLDQPGCPAMQCNPSPLNVFGSFKDAARIRELARRVSVLTVEIEHVDVDVLEEVATVGVDVDIIDPLDGRTHTTKKIVPVHPSWRTLRLIQNKFDQKEHFSSHGIPIARQMELAPGALDVALQTAAASFGFPFMVKAKRDSYDGRGNFKVSSAADFERAAAALGPDRALYAEKWVPFIAELSVMVIRTEDDNGALTGVYPYPAVETVHEDSICSLVFMPPRTGGRNAGVFTGRVCARAQELAVKTVSCLWGRGVFAVEMFVQCDGSLSVNEVAPRPHNSGHHTIEAVPQMSQFKAQLYSILDMMPPGTDFAPRPRTEQALMINVLGGADQTAHLPLVRLAEAALDEDVDAHVHLYGKEPKPNRKIGHITLTTPLEQSMQPIEELATKYIASAALIRQDCLAAAALMTQQPTPLQPPLAPTHLPPLVTVTMGSDSDMPTLRAGLEILEKFAVPFEVRITSAHRTPHLMMKLAQEAAARGVQVIIAAAGGAAHLPGMLASETSLPVIGVPVRASQLDGLDSLLSIVQMPRGIPTATVGINNSTNAALLAIRILATHRPEYREKMEAYMRKMGSEVEDKNEELGRLGYARYLAKNLAR